MTTEQPGLFGQSSIAQDDARLIDAYRDAGRTLDDLPHTPEFDRLTEQLRAAGDTRSAHEIYRRLHNLRKASKLPALGLRSTGAFKLEPEHETLLIETVESMHGPISTRDQLPHTPAMAAIVERFNAESGLALDAHAVWRVIAKLAK